MAGAEGRMSDKVWRSAKRKRRLTSSNPVKGECGRDDLLKKGDYL
jgi:hypothetical protein